MIHSVTIGHYAVCYMVRYPILGYMALAAVGGVLWYLYS